MLLVSTKLGIASKLTTSERSSVSTQVSFTFTLNNDYYRVMIWFEMSLA